MTPEELHKLLDELWQRFGPAAAHLYELAVRQTVIVNGLWAIIAAILLIVGGSSTVWGWVTWRQYHNATGSDRATDVQAGAFFGGAVAFVFGFIFLIASLPAFLNPEYAAFKDLLSTVKP